MKLVLIELGIYCGLGFMLIRWFAVCGPGGISWQLSYELWSAPCRPTPARRVYAWLQRYSADIKLSARRFQVDGSAVAGVIAYEGLKNVEMSTFGGLTRADGPGKVHYKDSYFSEGRPAAKEAEEIGLLPRRTMTERARALSKPSIAIGYIAAIMDILASIASHSGYHIRCHPGVLATLYDGYSPYAAAALFDRKRFPDILALSPMGRWVRDHRVTLGQAIQSHPCVEIQTQIWPRKTGVSVKGSLCHEQGECAHR